MFGIFVIPIGLAVRCVPDAWVVAVSRALGPLAWPLLIFFRWTKRRRAEERRRIEVRRQKRGVEGGGQGPSHDGARQHPRWVSKALGRKEEAQRSPDMALTAVDGVVARKRAVTRNALGDQTPLDLWAGVETSKYGRDGALPGLHVHPETAKDDPVLLMPPTPLEVLAGAMTTRSHLIPPSQH